LFFKAIPGGKNLRGEKGNDQGKPSEKKKRATGLWAIF